MSKYMPVLSDIAGRRMTPSSQMSALSPPLVELSTNEPWRPVRTKLYSTCASPLSSVKVQTRRVLSEYGYSALISGCCCKASSTSSKPFCTQFSRSLFTASRSFKSVPALSKRLTPRPPKLSGSFKNTTGWWRRKSASASSPASLRSKNDRPRYGANVRQNSSLFSK